MIRRGFRNSGSDAEFVPEMASFSSLRRLPLPRCHTFRVPGVGSRETPIHLPTRIYTITVVYTRPGTLSQSCGSKRSEVTLSAWREWLALNIFIWLGGPQLP